MKVIYNNAIPFKGYKAMTIWPFIFVRNSVKEQFNDVSERHERIHGEQQKEMLLIGFYLWYILEYLVRLAQYKSHDSAYSNISFEREAKSASQYNDYLADRRHYAWTSYL